MSSSRDPTLRAPLPALLREPLFWAAGAVFVGAAVGLFGTLRLAAAFSPLSMPSKFTELVVLPADFLGGLLLALSLLGVPALVKPERGGRIATNAGVGLILLFVVCSFTFTLYAWLWTFGRLNPSSANGRPPLLFSVCEWASVFLLPAGALLLAASAFLSSQRRVGAVLLGLGFLPPLLFWYLYPNPLISARTAALLAGLLGGGVVGIAEIPLWALLGLMFLTGAREQALKKAASKQAKGNLKKARRLYEEGLGQGDLSVLEELVSEDFHDLRHGGRGRGGMREIITNLRGSFPDLAVVVEGQEAEEDLVRTSLVLSGTDRGGVLWYPPTNRHATFSATFTDRFEGGKLVEHGGKTYTEELLEQLGLGTKH